MAPGGLRAGNLPAELTSFVGRRSEVAEAEHLDSDVLYRLPETLREYGQIAARLVISQRTAEGHVQHILTKLGFTSRAQVAAWIVASQPDDDRR